MTPPARVVLLSVRSPHVDRLLEGTKTVELRRRRWNVQPGTVVLLYASGARRALVGSFVVGATEVDSADEIWRRLGGTTQLSRAEFDQYLADADEAVAIHVTAVKKLKDPLSLAELRRRFPSFTAPQSFRYVAHGELSKILNGERSVLLPGNHKAERSLRLPRNEPTP